MPKPKGRHLSKEDREVVEEGIRAGDSARRIAKRIGVSASTVTREARHNRTVREKKPVHGAKLSIRCMGHRSCQASGTACEKCSTRLTACKDCRTRSCIDTCPDYRRAMCPMTEAWPYVCPASCKKRAHCSFPKCSYDAADAECSYRGRLRSSRAGIGVAPDELEAMDKLVAPLIKQGQSFEAIWETHAAELPVCVRTAYSYQGQGLLSTANIELPRKARCRPRKKKDVAARERVDRAGRTFDDFKALPLTEQVRVVQADSVIGYERNERDILSLHIVAATFQIYLLKEHASAQAVVTWLDVIERACGSRGAFEAMFGILLLDRGVEFDDWAGMEASCLEPGQRRCRVFYCDPMETNQKSQCERNHEQLRRLLPKGRSDFDRLSVWDVAVCSSHVNSYPSAGRGGKCGFDLAAGMLSQGLLDELGLERVAPDDVVLKPYLMKHAVTQ
jgi:IS30 family transposase